MNIHEKLALQLENWFNEEDSSVGLYATGIIDEVVITEFKEYFEDVEVISYDDEELVIKLEDTTYSVKLDVEWGKWITYRVETIYKPIL